MVGGGGFGSSFSPNQASEPGAGSIGWLGWWKRFGGNCCGGWGGGGVLSLNNSSRFRTSSSCGGIISESGGDCFGGAEKKIYLINRNRETTNFTTAKHWYLSKGILFGLSYYASKKSKASK